MVSKISGAGFCEKLQNHRYMQSGYTLHPKTTGKQFMSRPKTVQRSPGTTVGMQHGHGGVISAVIRDCDGSPVC